MTEPIKPATNEQVQTIKAGLERAFPARSAADLAAQMVAMILIARIESDAAKLAERDEQIAALFDALEWARENVADWAAYADEYFQTKHDLAGDLARIDAVIARRKEASSD